MSVIGKARPAGVRDDVLTVAAVGVLAATLAAVCHETVGHGLGCAAVGGRITLLTSIYFRCEGATALTDVAGPLGNLAGGLAGLALLRIAPPRTPARLFLFLISGLNLFWFAGHLAYSSALDRDDWPALFRWLGGSPAWRFAGVAAGTGAYLGALRLLKRQTTGIGGRSLRIAYLGGALSAAAAGLAWAPEPVGSALNGVLALGVAPLGLLRLARRAEVTEDGGQGMVRSWAWTVAGIVVYAVFVLLQARGLGALAGDRLPP
jgi:hypothetical protein